MSQSAVVLEDKDFTSTRAASRREDSLTISAGKATPAELQKQNSILPDDFWSKAQVNWNALSIETRSDS